MRFKTLVVVIAILLTVSCFRSQKYDLPEDKLSRLKSLNEVVDLSEVFTEQKWDYICSVVEISKPHYSMSSALDLETKQYSFYGARGTSDYEYGLSFINEQNKTVHTFIIPWTEIEHMDGETCLKHGQAFSQFRIRETTNGNGNETMYTSLTFLASEKP